MCLIAVVSYKSCNLILNYLSIKCLVEINRDATYFNALIILSLLER